MIRLVIVFIFLISGFLPYFASAGETKSAPHSLKNYQLQSEGGRLTGELKNVAIEKLLEEVLQIDGFRWEVNGKLNGSISISLSQLTVEQCIKKIMRLNHFNYALIFDHDDSADNNNPHRIKNLTIYQKDEIVRFSRTSQITLAAKKKQINLTPNAVSKRTTAVSPVAKPLAEKKQTKETLPSDPAVKEISAHKLEMKAYVDDLLGEDKITQEEYDALIGEMKKTK